MARILTNGQFATTGIVIQATGKVSKAADGSWTIQPGAALTLKSGLCMIAAKPYSQIWLGNPYMFVANKLSSTPHRIADYVLGTHHAEFSQIMSLNDQSIDIDGVISNYMNCWSRLNEAEKAVFLNGISAAVSGSVCGWQSTAFFLDCITPGGPLIPVFSGLLALASGAMCTNSLQNMSSAAHVGAHEAVKMKRYSEDLNRFAMQMGCDSSTILWTPMISSYCTWMSKICVGMEDIANQTVGRIGSLLADAPGARLATT
jgi:hypothetical protein